MKRTLLLTCVIVLGCFAMATYFSSCNPDACVTRATVCNNGGTCKDGDCICAIGYEGDSCQFTVNKKFDSYYTCSKATLNVIGGNEGQQVEDADTVRLIMKSGDKSGLYFYSIKDSILERIYCTTSGNYITIPQQDINFFGDLYRYYGSGSMNEGWLTLTFFREYWDGPDLVFKEKRTYAGRKYDYIP